MTHSFIPDADQLERHLAGETSEAEFEAIERWLVSNPELAKSAAELQGKQNEATPGVDMDRVWKQVARATVVAKVPSRSPRHTWVRRNATGIVAAASVVGMMVVGMQWMAGHTGTQAATAEREYVTQRAQRASFELPDGTQVTLAPDSRAEYMQTAVGDRVVTLTGQAYFTVTHDPKHPFSVRTDGVMTRVLGTSFSVRAYASDAVTQIAVADGKVAVSGNDSTAVLLPGDVGRVANAGMPMVERNARLADVFGWMRGQIVFADAPLREVVAELERMFNVTIRVSDAELADRPVSMRFTDRTLGEVLDAVIPAVDATYRREGDTVIVAPR